MRLSPPLDGLAGRVAERLDRRLNPESAAPLAIAFSGGGDSLALLLAADAWARAHGRDLQVLHVDHRLQPQSRDWAAWCAQVAASLGRPFTVLAWTGAKPERGLPAAARAARHRLLAEAARASGARVILLGHTADDVSEAAAMREAGSTTPAPREWAPSPAWPQGRGVFLLRPMLALGRGEIREALAADDRTWVEDPANANQAYARARARAQARGAGAVARTPPEKSEARAELARLAEGVDAAPWGGLSIARERLRQASPPAARALVGAACLCAAGESRPPRTDRLERLLDLLRGTEPLVATLAGARIEADGRMVRFLREPGELKRTGLSAQALPPNAPIVWDGRFELRADQPGLVVRPLAGHAARLAPSLRRALAATPAHARGGLPLVFGDPPGPACPLLEPVAGLAVQTLAGGRLAAACGRILREP
ncbi:MAG: tRNA lysidine(34) synthetase TilS [Phenylobacterium sp.]|uniref:tRNA lysidine(34) synthetase TilS n=1 Tax=Phenylobacterium sp. TaxID=1871053 RepID=UPI00391915B2